MSAHPRTNWIGLAAVGLVLAGTLLFMQKRHPRNFDGLHGSMTVHADTVATSNGPTIDGCPVFPADNVWNTRIDRLPVDKNSNSYLDSMGPLHKLHPDFGEKPENGIPYTTVPAGTPAVKVDFDYLDDSDPGPYPIPADAPVEGGSAATGDRHILLIDNRTCLLYELFAAQEVKKGKWKAGSGIVMDMTSNALRADGKTSGDAAGLPIFPGLVRYEEVESGEIRHAIRFTLPQTQAAYIWPARHQASKLKSTNIPPMGQRFRLRADFDDSKFSPAVKVITTAMKRYGIILADNGGTLYVSGVPDKRWNDDELHHLSDIKVEDFEAIDESSLQLLPDSARAIASQASH